MNAPPSDEAYLYEAGDTRQTFLVRQGHVDGHKLHACTVLADGDDGLIRQVRVLMRPWPVSKLFRDAMYEVFGSIILQQAWELGPKPAAPAPRRFTPIALQYMELSAGLRVGGKYNTLPRADDKRR